jgi:hypothetical protein
MKYAIAAKNRGDAVAHVKWVMKQHGLEGMNDVVVLGTNTIHDIEKLRDIDRGGMTVYLCHAVPFAEGEFTEELVAAIRSRHFEMIHLPLGECWDYDLGKDGGW